MFDQAIHDPSSCVDSGNADMQPHLVQSSTASVDGCSGSVPVTRMDLPEAGHVRVIGNYEVTAIEVVAGGPFYVLAPR